MIDGAEDRAKVELASCATCHCECEVCKDYQVICACIFVDQKMSHESESNVNAEMLIRTVRENWSFAEGRVVSARILVRREHKNQISVVMLIIEEGIIHIESRLAA